MQRLLPTLAVTLLLAGAAAAADKLPPLNAEVLAFAEENAGKKVGNGECWTLADEALRAAGAKRPNTGGFGVYVFGKEVALKKVLPGDILQFEGVRFERHKSDGSWYWFEFPHHTAVVAAAKGRTITLWNQHVNGDKKVRKTVIDLDDLQKGTITAYRPVPQ
jgi:hypothetical protein